MPPPCGHDPPMYTPGEEYDQTRHCRLCYLFATRDDYRKLWEEQATATFPPLWKQALTFGAAVVRHAADGFKQAGPASQSRRMALCLACEHWREERCTQCGCGVVAKTAWKSEKCPVGRW